MGQDRDKEKTVIMPRPGGGRRAELDPEATVVMPTDEMMEARAKAQAARSAPRPDETVIMSRPPAGNPSPRRGPDPAGPAPVPKPVAGGGGGLLAFLSSGRRTDTAADAVNHGQIRRHAAPLLALAVKMRQEPLDVPLDSLRTDALAALGQFDRDVQAGGADGETARAAQYLVAAFVDENFNGTPFGAEWAKASLVSHLFQETSGGERFYEILSWAGQNPRERLGLLEVAHACLALGFRGKYGGGAEGEAKASEVRRAVFRSLKAAGVEPPQRLSGQWEGAADPVPAPVRRFSIWVVGSAAAVLLAATFLVLKIWLGAASDPVATRLAALAPAAADTPLAGDGAYTFVVDAPADGPGQIARLASALQPYIDAGLVEVLDNAPGVRVRIKNAGLFASGSDRVAVSARETISGIGRALTGEPGPLLVRGHTDSVPTRGVRFASNWELSQSRAEAVAALLSPELPRAPKVKGVADTEPIADNGTREGQARNRRIEIDIPPAEDYRGQAPAGAG